VVAEWNGVPWPTLPARSGSRCSFRWSGFDAVSDLAERLRDEQRRLVEDLLAAVLPGTRLAAARRVTPGKITS
jgi:hypothetical protein